MAYNVKIYKIAIRNIKTNEFKSISLKKNTKDENDLKAIDKELAKYDSKEEFIYEYIGSKDAENYDVYIYYNSSNDYKFYDTHFEYKLSDESKIDKLLDNIIYKGFTNFDFIQFINKNNKRLYEKFDSYSNGVFEGNKLCRFNQAMEYRKFERSSIYKERISQLLKEDYCAFRKLVDLSYRYARGYSDLTEDRKQVNYSTSFPMNGQMKWSDIGDNTYSGETSSKRK